MSKTGACEQAIRMYMDAMTEAMDNKSCNIRNAY